VSEKWLKKLVMTSACMQHTILTEDKKNNNSGQVMIKKVAEQTIMNITNIIK